MSGEITSKGFEDRNGGGSTAHGPNFNIYGNEETISLISNNSETSSKGGINESELTCKSSYFPLLYFILSVGAVIISTVQYFMETWTGPFQFSAIIEKLPPLRVLPTLQPYFFQMINIVATCALFATYYCLFAFLRQKFAVPEYKNQTTFIIVVFAFGFLAGLMFFVFSILPSERIEQNEAHLGTPLSSSSLTPP
jgi:hypothetical protein